MKKSYIMLALLATGFTASAQQFAWGKTEGEYAYDYGYGIQTDNAGNVYVAGKYEHNDAMFSGTKVSCEGNHDAFLAKYTADGTLTWIRTAGGTLGDYAQAMYCDASKYVYMGGEIEGVNSTIKFSNSNVTLTGKGNNDAFFAKYDLEGNLIWARSFGVDVYSEKVLAMCADNNENLYIAGYFSTTTEIGGQTLTGAGGRDIYVAKFDKDGNFVWVRQAGSDKRDEVKGIRCDDQGNVYLCGWMSNGCKFEGQTYNTFKNTEYADIFLAKYDTNGSLQWVKTAGSEWDDVAWSIVIAGGKIYVTGEFNAYVEFGSNANSLTTEGGSDIFVAAYSTAGDVLWVRRAGSDADDRARGIGTDGHYLFVTGQIGGKNVDPAIFGSHQVMAVDTSDVFIASMSTSGNWLWVTTIGGAPDKFEPLGYESGIAVTGHAGGNVYATGGVLCDPDNTSCRNVFGSIQSSPFTRTDVFVTKLTFDPGTVSLGKSITANHQTRIIPNPTNGKFRISLPENVKGDVSLAVYDCTGRQLLQGTCSRENNRTLDLSEHPEGVYFVELRSGDSPVSVQKLIVQH